MGRIDFYHLQKQNLEQVLPKLLQKAYETGKNIKIKVGTEERVDFISSFLWTFNDEAFIPHGTKKDGFADAQPIYISAEDDLPNKPEMLFLTDNATINSEETGKFERIFNIFDGNVENDVQEARNLWKNLKDCGMELYCWQQNDAGVWQQK